MRPSVTRLSLSFFARVGWAAHAAHAARRTPRAIRIATLRPLRPLSGRGRRRPLPPTSVKSPPESTPLRPGFRIPNETRPPLLPLTRFGGFAAGALAIAQPGLQGCMLAAAQGLAWHGARPPTLFGPSVSFASGGGGRAPFEQPRSRAACCCCGPGGEPSGPCGSPPPFPSPPPGQEMGGSHTRVPARQADNKGLEVRRRPLASVSQPASRPPVGPRPYPSDRLCVYQSAVRPGPRVPSPRWSCPTPLPTRPSTS